MHYFAIAVVASFMLYLGSDVLGKHFNYAKLRHTPACLLVYVVFLLSLILAASNVGVLSVIATGLAALLFGIMWREGT
jgi:hypothetical protein